MRNQLFLTFILMAGTAVNAAPSRSLHFRTLADSGVFVDSNGNVGIGTTSPGARLEVRDSVKILGTRASMNLGTVYGPASTDGFVNVSGRCDGAAGAIKVSVNVGGSSPAFEAGFGYASNDGVSYPGSAQLMVPIRKGEYYQILCNGGTSCGGSYFLGALNAYFTPLGL